MKNYTLEEGLDSLSRIKLLMEYSLSKTSSENVLLLSEQENELAMDRRLGIERRNMQALGYNPSSSSDMRKYRESIGAGGIKAATISEGLLKAREFFFTPVGMTAQIVLSIVGAPIGLPVAFSILDVAIFINDFSIMIKNWKPYAENSTSLMMSDMKSYEQNWFIHHWDNNHGFQLVIEDLLIIITGGAFKLVGLGAKQAYKIFITKTGSKSISKVAGEASAKLIEKKSKIKLLPKPLANWAEKKVNNLNQGIDMLKMPQKVKTSIKSLPKAGVMGALTYGFAHWLEKNLGRVDNNNVIELSKLNLDDKDIIDMFLKKNPKLFPTGINNFKMKFKDSFDEFFIVDTQ
jgi:hypothetical protein